MNMHNTFCKNIRSRRLELGWTQAQAAVAMKISQPTWAQLEAGRRVPTLDTVERAAKALRCTAVELISKNIPQVA